MAKTEEVKVPDIGDFDAVDVIEVLVSAGDKVKAEDGLITLESEKASMDVPSPSAGTVKEVKVAAGDQVAEGDVIVLLEVGGEDEEDTEAAEEPAEDASEEPGEAERAMKRPGSAPAGEGGGDEQEEAEGVPDEAAEAEKDVKRPGSAPAGVGGGDREETRLEPLDEPVDEAAFAEVYASPSIRRFARELGVDLSRVEGSGRSGRILREDVQSYVKRRLAGREPGAGIAAGAPGTLPGLGELPEIDFSQWGEVETEGLSKVQRLTGKNVHRAWLTIPHVTQHDEADVTELEAFRKSLAKEAEARGVKLTPIPFLIRAVVAALREFPRFNSSLAPDGESIVVKKYFHVGVAVDTEAGLVVPVVRDADRKGLFELAEEVADLAERARERKLKGEEMQGGTFTISSLGGIGGTAFTPIVNWPEVAILGVSRSEWRAVWRDEKFVPRLMLPLSLSYDHRVIDGARAVRFTTYLARVLEDLRRLLL